MRRVILTTILGGCALAGLAAQPRPDAAVGTWAGPAQCTHAGGETLTMTISRDADGGYRGSTDWARSRSDGGRGKAVPFTTVTVDGTTLRATTTADGRTARLTATLDGDTVRGGWAIDGDDDQWTFTARRQP